MWSEMRNYIIVSPPLFLHIINNRLLFYCKILTEDWIFKKNNSAVMHSQNLSSTLSQLTCAECLLVNMLPSDIQLNWFRQAAPSQSTPMGFISPVQKLLTTESKAEIRTWILRKLLLGLSIFEIYFTGQLPVNLPVKYFLPVNPVKSTSVIWPANIVSWHFTFSLILLVWIVFKADKMVQQQLWFNILLICAQKT